MRTLPVFSFPCTIVCIDDNTSLLESLKNTLSHLYQIKTFEHPLKALTFFQNYMSPLSQIPFLESCGKYETYDTLNFIPASLNLKNLTDISNYETRYNEIGIAIIDYSMPEMNGIELCKQLENQLFKKILLTGEAGVQVALDAFNANLIDAFILKGEPNWTEKLSTSINNLMEQYFVDITSNIRKHLEVDHILPVSDYKFANPFNNWCIEHNIREYYLADKNGSFLLIDNNGVKSHFIVHTDRSLHAFIDTYDDEQTAESFINEIKQRTKIPFFKPSAYTDHIRTSEWGQYFHKPQIINGKERYYWHENKVI